MGLPARPVRHRSYALGVFFLLLSGCNGAPQNGPLPLVFSAASERIGIVPIAGRLVERRGCVVILRGEGAFTDDPPLTGSDIAEVDIPVFDLGVARGTDKRGFYLQPASTSIKYRLGDLIQGRGFPMADLNSAPEEFRSVLASLRPSTTQPCGSRIFRVSAIKPFGSRY